MVWLIVYILGMIAVACMFSYLDSKYGNPDQTRENAHGRMITLVLWPIVVPFIVWHWISSREA